MSGGLDGPKLDFMAHPNGDLALARSYLIKAGYPSGRLDVTLDWPIESDPVAERVAEVVRTNLSPLGVKVVPEIVTTSKKEDECSTPKIEPALCQSVWQADFNDGEAMLQVVFDGNAISSTTNNNDSLLNDPVVNSAMAKADLIPDGTMRDKAWAFVDDLITADAPGIPDVWDGNYFPQSRNVHGVITAEIGWDFSYTWIS